MHSSIPVLAANLIIPVTVISAFEKTRGRALPVDSPGRLRHIFFEVRKNLEWSSRRRRRREDNMKNFASAMLAGVALSMSLVTFASAEGKVTSYGPRNVRVSINPLGAQQEPRSTKGRSRRAGAGSVLRHRFIVTPNVT